MKTLRFLAAAAIAAIAAFATAAAVAADAYPSRTIRLVVPFPPGGGFDGIARPFAEQLSRKLGQPVIVDNRPGAAGNIGTDVVARAPADGYTLLFANDYMGSNAVLYRQLPYDPVKDFVPISMIASTQMVIAVNPARVKATDAKSLKEESLQHVLQYGTPGVGTSPHLFGELYAHQTGTKMQHVPYRGTGPAVADALGGQIDFALVTVPAAVAQVRGGKLRALMVIGGQKRSPLLPDVPNLYELGVERLDHDVWYGLFAPAATPPEVLRKLREATAAVLAQQDLQARLREVGYELVPGTSEALAARVKSDLAKWKQVVDLAHITVD